MLAHPAPLLRQLWGPRTCCSMRVTSASTSARLTPLKPATGAGARLQQQQQGRAEGAGCGLGRSSSGTTKGLHAPAVSSGKMMLCCGQRPSSSRSTPTSRRTSTPRARAEPDVAGTEAGEGRDERRLPAPEGVGRRRRGSQYARSLAEPGGSRREARTVVPCTGGGRKSKVCEARTAAGAQAGAHREARRSGPRRRRS